MLQIVRNLEKKLEKETTLIKEFDTLQKRHNQGRVVSKAFSLNGG